MRKISLAGSPLPKICLRAVLLSVDAAERLEVALLPLMPATVAEYMWSVVSRLHSILRELPLADRSASNNSASRARILDAMAALMHDVAGLTEYLTDALAKLLPSSGRKNRLAQQAKDKLRHVVDRLFKIPINLVKHEHFKLQWLDQYEGSGITAGFTLNGKIDRKMTGPASYRYQTLAEGFSFAFILRKVLPSIFELCTIVEAALEDADLFDAGVPASTVAPIRADRLNMLDEVIARLATLSARGFPNERGERVVELDLQAGTLVILKTFLITTLPVPHTYSAEIESIVVGEAYKLPYWVSVRRDR